MDIRLGSSRSCVDPRIALDDHIWPRTLLGYRDHAGCPDLPAGDGVRGMADRQRLRCIRLGGRTSRAGTRDRVEHRGAHAEKNFEM